MAERTRRQLLLTLIDPLIMSSSSATAAAAPPLPYIPGGTIRGMALAAAYASDSSASVFEEFHTDKLFFEDALPVSSTGVVGFPVPLSLSRPKGEEVTLTVGSCNAKDGVVETPESGWSQCRSGAYGRRGERVVVATGSTTRTAIEEGGGRAAEGQLFEYRYLESGQRFLGCVEGTLADLERVAGIIAGIRLMGRARSAEFGRVSIEFLVDPPDPIDAGENTDAGDRYLWCLSDCMFWNQTGFPALHPTPNDLGGGTLDWSRSFVRKRRYSSFNRTWGARAPEREVVIRGSVFTARECSLAPGVHNLGREIQEGLGRILVTRDPPLMAIQSEMLPRFIFERADERTNAVAPPSELVAWLVARADEVSAATPGVTPADVRVWYKNAASLAGKPCGPAASQWGAVQEAARNRDRQRVWRIIGDGGEHQGLQGWRAACDTEESLGDKVRRAFPDIWSAQASAAVVNVRLTALSSFARSVRRVMDQENWLASEPGADADE